MNNNIMTVGIDVGTATTQLIFSRLYFKNISSFFTVPRIEIEKKEVIYQSAIHTTPLVNNQMIDFKEIIRIIDNEYALANIDKSEIDIGAVIITGESARKENSEYVLNELSAYAGDFVVATAGADLEAIIAARGAKIDEFTKIDSTSCINIDIGGGTSNYAYAKYGQIIDTGCLDIGGRIIKYDHDHKITFMTPKVQEIAKINQIDLQIGKRIEFNQIEQICQTLAAALFDYIGYESINSQNDLNRQLQPSTELLITNKQIAKVTPEYLSFSGGVSEYIYTDELPADDFHLDIGVVLAKCIKAEIKARNVKLFTPVEVIRATVFGAGMHSTKISGSTIYFDQYAKPFKNLISLKITDNELQNLKETLAKQLTWHSSEELFAISFELHAKYSYIKLNEFANDLAPVLNNFSQEQLIIIIENDYAKILGNILKPLVGSKSLIVIDNISVNSGDFIDIGLPVDGSDIIPVVTKTIIFN